MPGGSPCNITEIAFEGDWTPDVEDYDWQDLSARSPGGRYLLLIRWVSGYGNWPVFRLVLLDDRERTMKISRDFEGCCKCISWKDEKVLCEIRHWSDPSEEILEIEDFGREPVPLR